MNRPLHKLAARHAQAPLIALVAVLIYLGTLRNGLIWDDNDLILSDPRVQSVSLWPRLFSSAFFIPKSAGREASYYRPLVSLSYGIDYHLAGGTRRLWVYHLHNMLVHAGCCVLVFYMTRRVLWWSRRPGAGLHPPAAAAVPLLAALVFTTHLMHVESVAWVAGRTDLYCGLMMLGAWLVYDRARLRRRGWAGPLPWLAALLALLAMLAKEVGIVLVVLLAVWEVLRSGGLRAGLRRWRLLTPVALVTVLYVILRVHALRGLTTGLEQAHFDPWTPAGVATVAWSICVYLGKLVLPVWSSMGFEIEPFGSAWAVVPVLSVAAVLVLMALGVVAVLKFPRTGFAMVWFALTLLPALNLVPIAETAAERFLFIPSVGAALFLAVLGHQTIVRARAAPAPVLVRRAVHAAVLLYALAMAASVVGRVPEWRTEYTLCVASIRTAPGDARSHLALGRACERDKNRPTVARRHYRRAIELKTTMAAAYNNLGKLEYRQRKPLVALSLYYKAAGLSPRDAIVRCNIAEALMSLALSGMARERLWRTAKSELDKAVEANPRSADAYFYRGRWHLLTKGHGKQALQDFERATRLDPRFAEAHYWLGIACRKLGRTRRADAAFERATALDPALDPPGE